MPVDRTYEFQAVCGSVQHQQTTRKTTSDNTAQPKRSTFTLAAAKISRDIHDTSGKLQRLAKLAKVRSLFDDPVVEIQELTYIIKKDINNLNRELDALRQLSHNNGNKQTTTHSEHVVTTLQTHLRSATRDFKDVLSVRAENLKEQQNVREGFTGKMSSFSSSSPLLNINTNTNTSTSSGITNNTTNSDSQVIDMTGSTSQQMMMTRHTNQDRLNAVEQIETTMLELGGIMQQLAGLVAEQGETVQRIDDDIDSALENTEAAQKDLYEILEQVNSNKGLILKMLFVLVVFIVIFFIFFV